MRTSTMFVCQLSEAEQQRIRAEIEEALQFQGIEGEELSALIDNCMDDRLCNIDGTVDVWPYIFPEKEDPAPAWRFGAMTCIQVIHFEATDSEDPDEWEEIYTEEMDGIFASGEIRSLMHNRHFTPRYHDGKVIGFTRTDGSFFEFCDCDEQTYPEIHGGRYCDDL